MVEPQNEAALDRGRADGAGRRALDDAVEHAVLLVVLPAKSAWESQM